MFAALSATNEAIFRAQTADDMFRMACTAAVDHGKLLGAAIFTLNHDSPWFKLAAGTGAFPEIIAQLRFSSDPTIPEGQAWEVKPSVRASRALATTFRMILVQGHGCHSCVRRD
jgi:hypothetical protein